MRVCLMMRIADKVISLGIKSPSCDIDTVLLRYCSREEAHSDIEGTVFRENTEDIIFLMMD